MHNIDIEYAYHNERGIGSEIQKSKIPRKEEFYNFKSILF